MKTAIVGAGAAGFFAAINLKEMMPEMQVVIFEKSQHVLAKVKVSGGGRCNCTNSFQNVNDLKRVYPRGHKLIKKLFKNFSYIDAYEWFENHGVSLVTQEDQCVFPKSQSSQTIIDCFMIHVKRLGVEIRLGENIESAEQLLCDYDYVVQTTGGMPKNAQTKADLPYEIVEPVASLFTFNLADDKLKMLMGTVVEGALMQMPGTKLKSEGPLLITHWGVSGPATLKLSSYAARILHDNDYTSDLSINWCGLSEMEIRHHIDFVKEGEANRNKQVVNYRLFNIPSRLWQYICEKCLDKQDKRWCELNKKEINRLATTLSNDMHRITGKASFKEEFVTAGGISLSSVNAETLECKERDGLFFAGEVLDIDGITGGFNFQAAWTTAYTVAKSIAQKTGKLFEPK